METVTVQHQQQQHHHHVLNTQTSTESGWDNPFRPEGDLSREADEIVNLIRDGKPITPTGDYNHTIVNGAVEKKEISEIGSGAPGSKEIIKKETITQQQSAQNGKKSTTTTTTTSSKTVNDKTTTDKTSATTTKVSNTTVPGPASASYVVIEEKKNKKCNCCTIQ